MHMNIATVGPVADVMVSAPRSALADRFLPRQVALAAALLAAGSAWAQTAEEAAQTPSAAPAAQTAQPAKPAAKTVDLPAVFVTGARSECTLCEVPASAQAVDAEAMEAQ